MYNPFKLKNQELRYPLARVFTISFEVYLHRVDLKNYPKVINSKGHNSQHRVLKGIAKRPQLNIPSQFILLCVLKFM